MKHKFSKKLYLFVTFFLIQSCGLKITEHIDENVLLGTWELQHISCGSSFSTTTEKERFRVDNVAEIILTFEGSKITYASSGTCTTSSTGMYSTDFNGTSTGVLDIISVITGGTTCSESFTDIGSSAVGTVTVTTTLDGIDSKSLDWLVTNDKDILELKYFQSFEGSATSETCNSECFCKGIFYKRD